jgi:hypothetical protein
MIRISHAFSCGEVIHSLCILLMLLLNLIDIVVTAVPMVRVGPRPRPATAKTATWSQPKSRVF